MGYEVDRYVVERELGRGAFGAVYLARHKVLHAQVALKLLHGAQAQDPHAVDRFLREARAAASIGNPHIVRVSDAGVTPNQQAFLAMELLEGEDLAACLERSGSLRVHDAIAITRQILDGLAAAHDAGIVHRDMKPANVFLVRGEDGAPFAKLLDFGVSKMSRGMGLEGGLTATGTIIGTPHYMAPEQLVESRSVDGRADVYSVGVMLFEMLAGRLPYDADSLGALIGLVMTSTPVHVSSIAPHVPVSVAAVVAHALARDPGARFSSAREMSEMLRRCLDPSAQEAVFVPATHDHSRALPSTEPIGGAGSTLPMGGASSPGAASVPSPPVPVSAKRTDRFALPFMLLGALLLACPLALGVAGLALRERVSAAWSAFLDVPGREHAIDAPGTERAADTPVADTPPRPPEIPMHDGTEESVGNAGLSIERCARRRSDEGRWIVDMPITLRNTGETALVYQQSEFSADGYVATARSDFATLGMLAPGRAADGYIAWRATEDIAEPQTITVRFRGWARRVAVTDGPRLPPRPPPSAP